MRVSEKILLLTGFLLVMSSPAQSESVSWRGNVRIQERLFLEDPADPRQHGNNFSIAAQPEMYHEWEGGKQNISFIPFVRLDQGDDERTHADIRELSWSFIARDYEWTLGISKVYWGVTEAWHIVDIINQTDLVEDFDQEEKLGQPMARLALIRDWGTVDLFVLPGFRERTFAGVKGRPRIIPRVEKNLTSYESSQKDKHVDLAARWSHTIGDMDIGLSWFRGTSREPLLSPARYNGEIVLAPFYQIINQAGLDIQLARGSWLWKLEAINLDGNYAKYRRATGGFEYTFYGVAGSADLGLVMEYLYDSRGELATTPFEDDIMTGLRLTLNDEQSSDVLLGVIKDRHHDSYLISLEANRRIGNSWKLSIQASKFLVDRLDQSLKSFAKDDFLQIELGYYF
ncbi:hypothetical protein BMS3Bbin11_01337 [bacterium BMS3Bbin11]|nr:hypothetical protein BMS3Abin11_02220 [bacterium BMS3Abin11]GBE46239.1 hypothetical protein BMS3Bbin11_01337 [bacterium BMS3Bbin11]HDZ78453.1 hypothetical protein [Gammaproteobacteria bacterium]